MNSASLPANKIADYKTYFKKFRQTKDTRIKYAIEAANRILNQVSTYEEEVKRYKNRNSSKLSKDTPEKS